MSVCKTHGIFSCTDPACLSRFTGTIPHFCQEKKLEDEVTLLQSKLSEAEAKLKKARGLVVVEKKKLEMLVEALERIADEYNYLGSGDVFYVAKDALAAYREAGK